MKTVEEKRKYHRDWAAKNNLDWDRQIKGDSASGVMDVLLHEVEVVIARRRTRPAHELCEK